jgi:hypothetical protein
VQPKPLLGVFAHPAFDHAGDRLHRRLFAADTADVGNGDFNKVAWSAEGTRLYAGGKADPVRIWDQEGRGKERDVPVARYTITALLPCRDKIAVGAADPAFGLISLDGEKLVWQDSAIADMRDKLGSNFTVSNDGSKVRFGLGYGDKSPVLFDLVAGRLTDQPQPAAGLAEPDTTSLNLSDLMNNHMQRRASDDPPLEVKEVKVYEPAWSFAIAPGGDRFVLGTLGSVTVEDENKMLWTKNGPGMAWGE